MDFLEISKLFEKLEKTSARLEKILILRDFFWANPKKVAVVFDIISGNFQREINKKTIGISLKTIFDVLTFVSKKSLGEVEKLFNDVGDVGVVSEKILMNKTQKSLILNDENLSLEKIIAALKQISTISGKDSNKNKKEILSRLFLSAQKRQEYKFLSRLLIDDLRIGVSDGVLKEACVNSLFPYLLNFHLICEKCGYFNLLMKKCVSCGEVLSVEGQEELACKKFEKIIEIDTPKTEISLDNFLKTRKKSDLIKFAVRVNPKKYILKSENPRTYYNIFNDLFEKKYNLINSFDKILSQLQSDLNNVFKTDIILGNPIKSMLGQRVKNVDEAFKITGVPAFCDYKYDGLRVQIHNDCGGVRLFSRNLDELTVQFPEIVEFIELNFSDKKFVVDSECVAYDFKNSNFLPFQQLSRRILSKQIEDVEHIQVIVKIFDIMFLDGRTLVDLSYKKRREILEGLLIGRKLKQKINFDLKLLNKFKQNFEY